LSIKDIQFFCLAQEICSQWINNVIERVKNFRKLIKVRKIKRNRPQIIDASQK